MPLGMRSLKKGYTKKAFKRDKDRSLARLKSTTRKMNIKTFSSPGSATKSDLRSHLSGEKHVGNVGQMTHQKFDKFEKKVQSYHY